MTAPEMLTIEEFARRSGLSRATVRRRIADGSLKSWQPGGPRTAIRLPASLIAEAGDVPNVCTATVAAKVMTKRTKPRWQND